MNDYDTISGSDIDSDIDSKDIDIVGDNNDGEDLWLSRDGIQMITKHIFHI